jgi:hypothetical protein
MAAVATQAIIATAVMFLLMLAFRTFASREVIFVGTPAVPIVLTSRPRYILGIALYCTALTVCYLIINFNWGPFKQAFGPMLQNVAALKSISSLLKPDPDATESTFTPYIVVLIFVFLLTWDNKYNPFSIVLQCVLDALQIPERATAVYEYLKATRFGRLDGGTAKVISSDPNIVECDPSYFGMDIRDIEYKWAHICYLRYTFIQFLAEARNRRIFEQVTGSWEGLEDSYQSLSETFGLWARGGRDYRDAMDLAGKLNKLRDHHYRIFACVTVMANRDPTQMWTRVSAISRAPVNIGPDNLTRYLVLLIFILLIAVFVGRELSVLVFDNVWTSSPQLSHFDMERWKFWFSVSAVCYSVPLSAVFVFRRQSIGRFPFGARRYWGLYGSAFLLGYGVTLLGLPIFSGRSLDPMTFEFWCVVYQHYMIWSIMPGFVTAFVTYRMDTHAFLTDSTWTRIKDRSLAAIVGGVVGLVVSIAGCLDNYVEFSQAFAIVGCTLAIGASVGYLSRFNTSGGSVCSNEGNFC